MKQIVRLIFWFCSFAFASLFIGPPSASAQLQRLVYIGENPLRNGKPINDTTPHVNLLHKFDWAVKVTGENGQRRLIITHKPDTISQRGAATYELTALIAVNPQLIGTVYALDFGVQGSAIVKLNGRTLLRTGQFAEGKDSKYRRLKQDDYIDFVFMDTTALFTITYVPDANVNQFNFQLQIDQLNWAQKYKDGEDEALQRAYARGFYYMSFAIIFILLFIFHRERAEHFYFSMFCLFAAIAFLCPVFRSDFFDYAQPFFAIICFECLSIFLVRMFQNKQRPKWHLAIILVFSIVSFIPALRYCYLFHLKVNGESVSLPSVLVVLFYCYTGFASLYFLVLGLGQKRWEARAIVFICFSAIVLFWIVPAIVFSVIVTNSRPYMDIAAHFTGLAFNVGLFIFPLSGAFVLGRRNGLNQKQLTNQIRSIERLSVENLKKEQEKKQILEEQNVRLEEMVHVRTAEVTLQKEEIERKNLAITDNVTYAQRIQAAILPDLNLIYKALPQSFVFFLPKDIVSGDFYAFSETEDSLIIIAGDCTGHGVTGAFMSMIASALLTQIIKERSVTEPAAILNSLNKSIIETLRQVENESNDGMDISVCTLHQPSLTLQFAGANRPLWLVRGRELEVYKPDKLPIGGLQMARERTFTNHSIQLVQGDTFYIFTDGYADQFGGAFGKKMMTTKFKYMLLAIQDLDMVAQGRYLEAHFQEWKGYQEQVDDVLVVGVRV